MQAGMRRRDSFLIEGIVIAIHVILSLALISLVLLHAGKGGGLSDAFGGGMGPMGGMQGSTIVERNLDRLTVAVAVLFALTTVVLAFVLEA
jgi:preprotein translocase subunit SecG